VLRQRRGEVPAVGEHLARFPAHADALRRQFELHRALLGESVPSVSGAATATPAASESSTLPPVEMPGPAPVPPTQVREGRSTPMAAPGAASDAPVVPGYEVLGVLGEGGMGVVYQARQHGLDRLVALKTIHRHYAADPQLRSRFGREAAAIARLQHPHVVQVYAWGEYDGTPYFALEFCAGGSLSTLVKGRPQPPGDAALLVEKLARAVQAAHDAGIVHRDLKPANVLLQPAGDELALNTLWGIPKVADFGLCRGLEADLQRTAEGSVAGSPPYMAPEQAEGRTKDIGPATDVWALGVILYELLTGRPPFGAAKLSSILHAVCHEEPPRPGALQPGVPAGLEAICLRCLAKARPDRYPTAQALAEDLRRFLSVGRTYEERPIDDPLLRLRGLMRERLQPHAAFTTAVSFAKQGK
jgi:serine/threonine protein kinase